MPNIPITHAFDYIVLTAMFGLTNYEELAMYVLEFVSVKPLNA